MTQLQIAWLALFTVGGVGVCLIAGSFLIKSLPKKRFAACTRSTTGAVVGYHFPGGERMQPVVEYSVAGQVYQTKKEFSGTISTMISGMLMPVQSSAYEDKKGRLHIKLGPAADLRALAQQLWPVGGTMTVFYDPHEPGRAYVDRPVSHIHTVASLMLRIMGFVVIGLGIVAFLLIQP